MKIKDIYKLAIKEGKKADRNKFNGKEGKEEIVENKAVEKESVEIIEGIEVVYR